MDLLRALDGRRCPRCGEGVVRVRERGDLTLLTCSSGCPGARIETAARRGAGAAESAPVFGIAPAGGPAPEPAPALLPGLDPFQRFEARLNVAPDLRPALEALLSAEAVADLPRRGSLQAAITLLTSEPEERAQRSPLERTAAAIAATLLEGVLSASPGRRAEAASLLRAVAAFAAGVPAAGTGAAA